MTFDKYEGCFCIMGILKKKIKSEIRLNEKNKPFLLAILRKLIFLDPIAKFRVFTFSHFY